jgi:uncharacterized membrane protein YqhA
MASKSSKLSSAIGATRYLVLLPILGLGLAAAAFFVVGGFKLIALVIGGLLSMVGLMAQHPTEMPIEVEIVEYVHTFLIGTVLYITAAGLYQLFIREVEFPQWLRIDSTEELETNLIGVTVVVLAVNFMGLVYTGDAENLLRIGVGISLPIAALALFVGLRTWSVTLAKSGDRERPSKRGSSVSKDVSSSEVGE